MNISYNPYQVATAFKNSGKDINDPAKINFIQVESAWEHLTTINPVRHNLEVFYEVSEYFLFISRY